MGRKEFVAYAMELEQQRPGIIEEMIDDARRRWFDPSNPKHFAAAEQLRLESSVNDLVAADLAAALESEGISMADEETKDRRRHIVHVLRYHTHRGEEHHAGESYEVEEGDELNNLVANGMVSTEPPKPPEEPQAV